jgi:hypothetical protein
MTRDMSVGFILDQSLFKKDTTMLRLARRGLQRHTSER